MKSTHTPSVQRCSQYRALGWFKSTNAWGRQSCLACCPCAFLKQQIPHILSSHHINLHLEEKVFSNDWSPKVICNLQNPLYSEQGDWDCHPRQAAARLNREEKLRFQSNGCWFLTNILTFPACLGGVFEYHTWSVNFAHSHLKYLLQC